MLTDDTPPVLIPGVSYIFPESPHYAELIREVFPTGYFGDGNAQAAADAAQLTGHLHAIYASVVPSTKGDIERYLACATVTPAGRERSFAVHIILDDLLSSKDDPEVHLLLQSSGISLDLEAPVSDEVRPGYLNDFIVALKPRLIKHHAVRFGRGYSMLQRTARR